MAVCLCFIGNASAQWVVSDPGNLAQGIINTTKQIVQTSTTAKNTLDGFMEAQKIFQQGKVYYDALKAVHDVVKGGIKVKKSIELVAEISEIYVRNYQNMLADPNYTPDSGEDWRSSKTTEGNETRPDRHTHKTEILKNRNR